MRDKTNISFIPKKPLARKEVLRRRPIFGVTFIVSIVIAFISIGFASRGYYILNKAEQQRGEAMKGFDKYIAQLQEENLLGKIDEERDFVQITKVAITLLENHVAPSKIFTYLEETTPTKVAYQNFSYSKSDETVSINMRGKIGSFELLAALSQWYKKQSDVITEFSFGGFSPDDLGAVSFDFQAVLYPELISYVEKTEEEETETDDVSTEDSADSLDDVEFLFGDELDI